MPDNDTVTHEPQILPPVIVEPPVQEPTPPAAPSVPGPQSPVPAPLPAKDEPNLGGRPLLFKNSEEMQKSIDKYFDSCWSPELDDKGKPVYMTDKEGNLRNEIMMRRVTPYTMCGLALALGMTRSALLRYKNNYDGFYDTIQNARLICEKYAEESLFVGKNPAGVVFNLKNNYSDWKDKQEVEQTGQGSIVNFIMPKTDKSE